MSETKIKDARVRIGSTSRGGWRGNEVQIVGLKEEEADLVESSIGGNNWIRVEDGRIVSVSAMNPLPAPTDDPEMLPFWQPRNPDEPGTQLEFNLNDTQALAKQFCGSIVISGLCGYYYTPERYKEEAERLGSYGFQCMRSRRGPDGKYWESWYLPGAWAAKGELERQLLLAERSGNRESDLFKRFRKEMDVALEFLRTHCIFGSLDVTVQRLAMPNPD